MKSFAIIVAVDADHGIGKAGQLPWHLPSDLKHFAQLTTGGTVIMGRKTWESLPDKYRPLPKRLNIVLSRSPEFALALPKGVLWAPDLDTALGMADAHHPEGLSFLIGGGELFQQGLLHPRCDKLFLTEITRSFECDTFFPTVDEAQYVRTAATEPLQENGLSFRFVEYDRKR